MSDHQTIGNVLIAIGVAFDLFGTLGLLRLPDVYNRLQAATKCVTICTCFILVGCGVADGSAEMIVRSVICVVCVVLTAPVGAHALARGAHLGGVKLWEGSVVDRYEEDKDAVRRAHAQSDDADGAPQEESA